MPELSLKKQLKSLKQRKGIISKAIGDARKSGLDTPDKVEEVKVIIVEIKKIEKELKTLSNHSAPQEKLKKNTSTVIPSQFKPLLANDYTNAALKVTSQLAKEKWDFYVHNNPNATIYHTYSIREVIEKTFHHQCHYLSVIDDRQNVYAILPLVEMRSRLFGHFLVSIPFFNYGGILSSNQEASNILLKAAEELSQSIKSEHIEYRHCHDSYTLPSKSEKIAMLKNLPDDIEQLWSGLGTKLRAQIKKAERNSFTVKVGNINLINDFYKVFSNNMRDLGTPVYSKALFENMLNNNETAAIIMLYHQNKPVSTAFLLGWRNTLEIPWASTIKPANKLDANMKLYWEVLKFSIQKGYKIFDFGRSSKDANTYRFKKQWGAKSHELYWHYWLPNNKPLPEINPNNPKYKIMISVWKKLPLWIANIIGPEVVKNLP